LPRLVDGDEYPMLVVAAILLVWTLAAFAAVVLCRAARRGDRELTSTRPAALHGADGAASRRTRAS
jgi:hypothetical protein